MKHPIARGSSMRPQPVRGRSQPRRRRVGATSECRWQTIRGEERKRGQKEKEDGKKKKEEDQGKTAAAAMSATSGRGSATQQQ